MSKEKLLKRKQELQEAFDQKKADLQALSGAMQDVEYWLKELEDQPKADQVSK